MGLPTILPWSAGIWLMSEFWQKLQEKLQPTVAREKVRVPGRKWNSGFFSMGSTAVETGHP